MPVIIGISITVAHLLTTRYPDLGHTQTVGNDAKALATGHALYGEPGKHYTPTIYAPLMLTVLAPFYRIFWWDGWAPVLSTCSGVGIGVLVGVVAGSGRARPLMERVVEGVGVGGVAFWIVSTTPWNGIFTGRVDEPAWFLALSGLCALAFGVSRGWTRTWPAVVLLSGAVWTKQPTAGAAVAAIGAMAWWAAKGFTTWRQWRRFVVGFILANGIVLGVLVLLTHGWIWFFLIVLPTRAVIDPRLATYLTELPRLFAIPGAAAVVALIGGGTRWGSRKTQRSSFALLLGSLLIAFLVVQIGPAFLGRRKQGGSVDQYIGMMWAFGLLLALAHREAHRTPRALVAGTAVYLSLALVAFVPPVRDVIWRPNVVKPEAMPTYDVRPVDPVVIRYARSHLVYEPAVGVISPTRTDEAWPHEDNLQDLLTGGEPADYVVDALIQRRFDAVTLFSFQAAAYASASGRTSPEYVPALNALIRAGYAVGANDAPAPLLGRRQGQVDLSWARQCFTEPDPATCVREGSGTHP